jgi:hypothetical protein
MQSMDVDLLVDQLSASRAFFHRHLLDLPESVWTFKPFPECKNLFETLVHLRVDDLAALDALRSGHHSPEDYAKHDGLYAEMERGPEFLLARLAESRAELENELRDTYRGADPTTPICVWGTTMPLVTGIPYFCSEDYYHAGQAAYIRMAAQPDWNYYACVYG